MAFGVLAGCDLTDCDLSGCDMAGCLPSAARGELYLVRRR